MGGIDAAVPSADGEDGFSRALLACQLHNLPHEVLSADEVNARFPGYSLPSAFKVGLANDFMQLYLSTPHECSSVGDCMCPVWSGCKWSTSGFLSVVI